MPKAVSHMKNPFSSTRVAYLCVQIEFQHQQTPRFVQLPRPFPYRFRRPLHPFWCLGQIQGR